MAATEIIDVRTTTRAEWIDITQLVRAAIRKSGVDEGIACVFCPHTTAAVTIQENADPKVKTAMLDRLAELVPPGERGENFDAHIKGSIMGASVTLIVESGKPVLGPWQALFLCEFDGPRSRRLHVRVVSG